MFLHEALANAIRVSDLAKINDELERFAPPEALRQLAGRGIRGEFLFATPVLLAAKPNLLGYYRLLLGFSQKAFYQKAKLGRFQTMEESGALPERLLPEIDDLCEALNERAAELLTEIGLEKVTTGLLEELSLLTLGPQLRGSNNTRIGQLANRTVLEIIQKIVSDSVTSATATRLELTNAAQRRVIISFTPDPDISVAEELSGELSPKLAIEIKGGGDKSNIWNRLGEAEKSHQTAKQRGFNQFWTIYNVETLDLKKAREKSPTTQRFYSLIELSSAGSEQYADFRDHLISILGIRASTARA